MATTDEMTNAQKEECEAKRDFWKAFADLLKSVKKLVDELPRPTA